MSTVFPWVVIDDRIPSLFLSVYSIQEASPVHVLFSRDLLIEELKRSEIVCDENEQSEIMYR